MIPKKTNHDQERLFERRLSGLISPKNRLVILSNQVDWKMLEKELQCFYKKDGAGQPPKSIRLMVGLLMLQHMEKLSDEKVVKFFRENVYFQYFCGYDYIQWKKPINPTSLVHFRQRLGKKGVQKILDATVKQAIDCKVITKKDLKRVIADTTVMPKNIAHPADGMLLNNVRKKIVKLAQQENVKLRQNYNQLAKKILLKSGRYAHAKQFKRMRRCIKSLKTFLGRIVRDVDRKVQGKADVETKFKNLREIAGNLILQKKKTKNKIYSIHEPHVYCIAKGKARTPYEFGTKVPFVVTQKKGIVLVADALEKNEYDGHTLSKSLEKAENTSKVTIKQVLVDKGYKKHGIEEKKVYMSGQRRGITNYMKRQMRQRSSIEAHISHMKNDGKLGVSFLSGLEGDKVNAIFCAVGHNLRTIINNNYLIILWVMEEICSFGCLFVFFGQLFSCPKNKFKFPILFHHFS